MQATPNSLALAFTGSLTCALALGLALLELEPFPAACLIAMTTYCLAEFIEAARAAADTFP